MLCGGADLCQAQEGRGREVVAPSVPPRAVLNRPSGQYRGARAAPSSQSGDTHIPAPEGGAPSDSRSRVSQDYLTKPKENLGCRARRIRVSKQWSRKNDSVGFGDFSPLERSSVCLLVCKVVYPLDPSSGSKMLSLPWTAESQ